MTKESQIIRLPKKYGELINSLSNEEAGKIIKEIFGYKKDIEGLSKIYFDMIKVDLGNLESSAINGIKGGRPVKEKPQDIEKITPGYVKEKPQDIESDNLNEREREREREREEYTHEDFLQLYENKTEASYVFMKKCLDMGIKITHPLTEQFKKNLKSKFLDISINKKMSGDDIWEELQKMIDHHATKGNDFGNTIGRINTWFNPKFK